MSTGPEVGQHKSWPSHIAGALLSIWHIPGRMWAGALAAAPVNTWMRFGAIVIATLLAEQHTWIVWKGPWPEVAWKARLDWLGWFGMSAWFVVLIGIVALWDFRLNFSASRDGLKADMAENRLDAPAATVTTTTTTATEIPGAPS